LVPRRRARATGEGTWPVVERDATGNPTFTAVGHYADELVREDGAWVFSARRGHLDIPTALAFRSDQAAQARANVPRGD
jgi:hypothetical protein